MHKLIIDSCACTRLAEAGINPVTALAGSEFSIALTPDLQTEYRNKLLSSHAGPSERALAESILKGAATHGFFGYAGTGAVGYGFGRLASEADIAAFKQFGPLPDNTDPSRPRKRADLHQIVLAGHDLVLTDNYSEAHWKAGHKDDRHILFWRDIYGAVMRSGLLQVLRQSV